ncbi:hypothetical protein [Brevundimonas sp.]|uniref:hypothetical protein n=1 Tax=Brevundimonas sp. TaxID=1871086 RepID=UPI002ED89F4A
MADERPAFQVINDLFAKHGLSAPPWKLRDELASHLLSHRRQPEAREGHFTQPLYPHPAAPSADKLREVRQDVINQMADNIEKLALTPAKRELVKAAFRACIGPLSTPDALKGDAK